MLKKKMRTLIVTGKTERQWIDEMRVLELAHEQGMKSPKMMRQPSGSSEVTKTVYRLGKWDTLQT